MKEGQISYQATAGDDKIITAKPAILLGIILGEDQSGAAIEISDDKTTGDANIVIHITGDNLATKHAGYIPVNATFSKGIVCDIIAQTKMTFIFINRGL